MDPLNQIVACAALALSLETPPPFELQILDCGTDRCGFAGAGPGKSRPNTGLALPWPRSDGRWTAYVELDLHPRQLADRLAHEIGHLLEAQAHIAGTGTLGRHREPRARAAARRCAAAARPLALLLKGKEQ